MTADLTTSWLGLELRNPLVASSSPLTGDLEALRRLEDAGIGAVVLPSLFEEQIEHESLEMQRLVEYGAGQFAEAFEGYFPELERYATTTDRYLELVAAAKETLEVPVVASLNGTTRGGWIRYAKRLEDAGADAVELNVFLVPTDPNASCVETERRYLDLVAAVAESVSVPVDVKLAPFFTNLAHTARALDEAGASGLT
ncbi:MAG TPA: dihydroorotate dehydrogenase-like protein, partial [Actinobacteria bacterium]|nr:dihydroorotate dehydrogenase-like protein [Actinomycetota bacterium]